MKTLPSNPELVMIRIIADMITNKLIKREMEYLLEDYNGYEYIGRIRTCEELAKQPFTEIFTAIEGYNDLTEEAKNNFLKTIIPFVQCQDKGRLINTSIHHIEDRREANGIRVYLMEYGEMGYQYFNNGSWG